MWFFVIVGGTQQLRTKRWNEYIELDRIRMSTYGELSASTQWKKEYFNCMKKNEDWYRMRCLALRVVDKKVLSMILDFYLHNLNERSKISEGIKIKHSILLFFFLSYSKKIVVSLAESDWLKDIIMQLLTCIPI